MLSPPRILIIVRAGRGSIHRSWIWTTNGLADVAISVYDNSDFAADGARYLHRFVGGKLSGVMAFLEDYPAVIDEYDYFWLFEDDLVLPFDSLRRISALLARFPFALSAPGLSYDSFFSWPLSVANSRFLLRCTDFVEVMMPIMSRAFLRAAMPAFNDNFMSWGHEWLWRKLLNEQQAFAAILDSAPVAHTRPFGQGTLFKNRPAGSPDPDKELEAMLAKYKMDKTIPFRNFFGVTRDTPPRLLVQDAFLQEALRGYEEMKELPNDNFKHCIDTLTGGSRPITPYKELRELPGFRMVAEALHGDCPGLGEARSSSQRGTEVPSRPAGDEAGSPDGVVPSCPAALESLNRSSMNGPSLRQQLISKIWRGTDPWLTPPAAHTPHFQGWGSDHSYLTEAIDAVGTTAGRPCIAVEIGVWKGGSVITMASRMKELGIDGVVIAIDTWLGSSDHWILEECFPELRIDGGIPHLYDIFRSNVIEKRLQSYILPLPLDSLNAAHVLRHFGVVPSVLHVDAGHDFSSVMADLENWWPLLAEGGILIGDDYHVGGNVWPGVKKAFDTFFLGSLLENTHGKCRLTKTTTQNVIAHDIVGT